MPTENQKDDLEVEIPDDDDSLTIEIVDDTPAGDKGRKPVVDTSEVDEEAQEYSAKVQKRIKSLTHKANDERREKDRLFRENQELEKFARQTHERLRQMEQQYAVGEASYAGQVTAKAKAQLENAQEKYRKAFESGDPEAVAKASADIAAASHEESTAKSWAENAQRKAETALQQQKDDVDLSVTRSKDVNRDAPAPEDKRAKAWAESNSAWFGKDPVMTATAYGVHEKLIKDGLHPIDDADDYYSEIDAVMRKRYSDFDWDEVDDTGLDEDTPPRRTASKTPAPKKTTPKSAVAPVTRTPTGNGKRVVLTQSQLHVAGKMGLTPEQYARELIKISEGN